MLTRRRRAPGRVRRSRAPSSPLAALDRSQWVPPAGSASPLAAPPNVQPATDPILQIVLGGPPLTAVRLPIRWQPVANASAHVPWARALCWYTHAERIRKPVWPLTERLDTPNSVYEQAVDSDGMETGEPHLVRDEKAWAAQVEQYLLSEDGEGPAETRARRAWNRLRQAEAVARQQAYDALPASGRPLPPLGLRWKLEWEGAPCGVSLAKQLVPVRVRASGEARNGFVHDIEQRFDSSSDSTKDAGASRMFTTSGGAADARWAAAQVQASAAGHRLRAKALATGAGRRSWPRGCRPPPPGSKVLPKP